MSRPARHLEVSSADKRTLDQLLGSGVQQVRVLLRALAIRQLGDGYTATEAAAMVRLTPKAVRALAARYRQGGLERALFDAPRPGKAPGLEQQQQQRIIAVVCSPPPEGRARWTVRLLTEEVIKRKLVPRVGREAIRILLESHDLKPWREKNVVRRRTG